MLIKAIYNAPDERKYLVLLPDGHYFLCPVDLGRRVTFQDLSPVEIEALPVNYWKCISEHEIDTYEPSLLIHFAILGLTPNPIKAARYELQLTQAELGTLCGLSKRRIQRIETKGFDLGTIRAKNALSLIDVLGLDINLFA